MYSKPLFHRLAIFCQTIESEAEVLYPRSRSCKLEVVSSNDRQLEQQADLHGTFSSIKNGLTFSTVSPLQRQLPTPSERAQCRVAEPVGQNRRPTSEQSSVGASP